MPDRTFLALPQFLRFLSAHPGPSDVMHALVRGPLARYGAVNGLMWTAVGSHELRLIGAYGTHPGTDARFAIVPLPISTPAGIAFSEHRVVADPLTALPGQYPIMAIDPVLADSLRSAAPTAMLVNAPITSNGVAIGALAFRTEQALALEALDDTFLAGVCAALGIWLSHPQTTITEYQFDDDGEAAMSLTERQRQILRRVLDGRSNGDIADGLGFSQSTVKQELQRAMRNMHATNRMVAAERAWELGFLATDGGPDGTAS